MYTYITRIDNYPVVTIILLYYPPFSFYSSKKWSCPRLVWCTATGQELFPPFATRLHFLLLLLFFFSFFFSFSFTLDYRLYQSVIIHCNCTIITMHDMTQQCFSEPSAHARTKLFRLTVSRCWLFVFAFAFTFMFIFIIIFLLVFFCKAYLLIIDYSFWSFLCFAPVLVSFQKLFRRLVFLVSFDIRLHMQNMKTRVPNALCYLSLFLSVSLSFCYIYTTHLVTATLVW